MNFQAPSLFFELAPIVSVWLADRVRARAVSAVEPGTGAVPCSPAGCRASRAAATR